MLSVKLNQAPLGKPTLVADFVNTQWGEVFNMELIKCKVCGEEIPKSKTMSKAIYSKKKYCSKICYGIAKTIISKKECPTCKQIYKPVRMKQIYCSSKCAMIDIGRKNKLPLKKRFMKYVSKPNENGCMEWQGTIMFGYGYFAVSSRPVRAHRYAWEKVNGPIPEGMYICHKCDNRKCVNINHLFVGTHQDNMDDMMEKNRSARGEKNSQAKLTREQALEIKHSKEKTSTLAKKYNVSGTIIKGIRSGKGWKHLREIK